MDSISIYVQKHMTFHAIEPRASLSFSEISRRFLRAPTAHGQPCVPSAFVGAPTHTRTALRSFCLSLNPCFYAVRKRGFSAHSSIDGIIWVNIRNKPVDGNRVTKQTRQGTSNSVVLPGFDSKDLEILNNTEKLHCVPEAIEGQIVVLEACRVSVVLHLGA